MTFKKLSVLFILICTVISITVSASDELAELAVIKKQIEPNTEVAQIKAEKTSEALNSDAHALEIKPDKQPSLLTANIQKNAENPLEEKIQKQKNEPSVGKHVMANMNPANMILSLFLVLGLIIICAMVLKRFNITQQGVSHLKVISTLRLGAKERLIVVQVGEKQLLLGVANQQISLLDTLSEPILTGAENTELPKNILSFLTPKTHNT